MSASTSAKLLEILRDGETPPADEVRAFARADTGRFFREVVEPLSDSFDVADAAAYEQLMRIWIPPIPRVSPVIPARMEKIYVLSRVTLGADIKIVSPILATMKRRFPGAHIILVSNGKSAELFETDSRIGHLRVEYPRSGSMQDRLNFAGRLRVDLAGANRIVVDPDSRMTQLGLIPAAESEAYFHFRSRIAGKESFANLTDLTATWLSDTFGMSAPAYIAPRRTDPQASRFATVSLGVGDNESKRVHGDFEEKLIAALGAKYEKLWVDRGAGGEEAARVTTAVERSGVSSQVRFWEGGFAGFASLIAQSDLYVGYDSVGQHAAAAAGTRLICIFAGAPSKRFRARWAAAGSHVADSVQVIADERASDAILEDVMKRIAPPLN